MNVIKRMREIHGNIYEYRKMCQRKKQLKFNMTKSPIHIMTIDETLAELEKGRSIARFGDGEMDIIIGKSIGFQKFDSELAKELKNILIQSPPGANCLIAIPDAINTFNNLTKASVSWWTAYMLNNREYWINVLDKEYFYGNTNVSRCYIRYEDKSECAYWFNRMMKLWKNREIVVIEGSKTRLGCGNDFLKEALSIERILTCPEDAFSKRDEIETYVKDNVSTDKLILLALGPTATIIAYDLSQCGYQALDIGHADIEYEWFRRGTQEKVAIIGKYTNEAEGGRVVDESLVDEKYRSEILAKII